MKSASTLNDKPPFLKGLSVPEVALLTGVMTTAGFVVGITLAIYLGSLSAMLACLVVGVTTILWLPKSFADALLRLREGKPRGWLYQRLDELFYTAKYVRQPGRYHHKKEKHHA